MLFVFFFVRKKKDIVCATAMWPCHTATLVWVHSHVPNQTCECIIEHRFSVGGRQVVKLFIYERTILYRCFVSVSSHGAPSVEWRKRRARTRHFWEVAKRGTNYICTHRGVLLTFRNLDIVFHRYKNCDAERQKSTGEPNSQAWYRLILWCGTALNSVAKH